MANPAGVEVHGRERRGVHVEDSILRSVLLPSEFAKPVLAVFHQPTSSCDGGALLLKLAGDPLGRRATCPLPLLKSTN